MKLAYLSRTTGKKGETNKIRREGGIPAVLYGKNRSVESIYVEKEEVDGLLRNMKPGLLATSVLELHHGGKHLKVLVKEIQYHRTSYAIEHIDFITVDEKTPVSVNVPIQIVGAGDCVGVKLGGFIRQAIRTLKVSCLLADIPQEFTLDVRDMEITHAKRLSDIAMPSGVKPIGRLNEVAVVVVKKA
jgi:large subunit ribosomal protein L25